MLKLVINGSEMKEPAEATEQKPKKEEPKAKAVVKPSNKSRAVKTK